MSDPATWTLLTPSTHPAAVAVVQICGPSDDVCRSLGFGPLGVGQIRLRDFGGADRGLVARWAHDSLHLMPHAGPAVVRAVLAWLTASGIAEAPEVDPERLYPEARDRIEALVLDALAKAESPLAVDLLLSQPRRWRGITGDSVAHETVRMSPDPRDRLIRPPLVAAIGPSNIGKSTLVNTLARRAVSIVADEPGTTRDHVGVSVELGGLVVRYVDCPGFRDAPDATEREAIELALGVARGADLLLLCGDCTRGPIDPARFGLERVPAIRAGLRGDLGRPIGPADVLITAPTGTGIADLVRAVRDALLPPAVMNSDSPWEFWRACGTRLDAPRPP